MTTRRHPRQSPSAALACAAGAALMSAAIPLFAADTDIAEVPLASSSSIAVKPNIFYVLDDSGSMDEDSMPDEMNNQTAKVTFRSHLCNTIYYNPAVFYAAPPKTAAGKRFADQSFLAAVPNGYSTAAQTGVNLSTGFRAHGGDTAQPAYYYVLSAGAAPASPLDSECRGGAPSASSAFPHEPTSAGGLTWKKVQVSATSGLNGSDERTNFANWYSYYRTRLMMMKAATGRSFVALADSYRVGFITINPYVTGVLTSKYLRIADFDSTHKQAFLDKLYGQATNGATPLREALARAGWVYAGQLGSGLTTGIPASDDPVEYSCQQNFTLLTTDGYWNGNRGLDLSGNPVDNQDADITEQKTAGDPARTVTLAARPIYDSGASSTETTTTTTNTYFYSTQGCNNNRRRIRYNSTVEQRVISYSGTVQVSDQTTTNTTTNNLLGGNNNCSSSPAPLPSPNPSVTVTNATAGASGGSFNSLADVAQYYYKTDLRPAMPDNVREAGQGIEDDRAPWQHMTTFTMGLGIFGQLNYIANYKTSTDPNSDFNKLRTGALNWPAPTDTTTIFNEPAKADDLWHAAVNGRGVAFNASNPDSVVSGLQQALASMNAIKASAAAAATSNLEPVAGDNFAYTASYETVKWQGELQAREIDLATGLVGETPVWSAQAKLDALVRDACDTRKIHLFRSGAAGNLVPFKWNTDTCVAGAPSGTPVTTLDDQEKSFFTDISALSHYPQMTDGTNLTVDQRTPAAGANLVNFLRGQRGKETFVSNSVDRLYRARERILGDIVNAQPVFVRQPFANYTDTGYSAFKSTWANRTPIVYVAANDGMLHAFYAGTSTTDPQGGTEAWAFIPTMVLPNLKYLADNNYANLHRFYVDGTPVAGDIFDAGASQWKTILVGGLNKGGQGYYALDITDPANPKALWEFKFSSTCSDPLVVGQSTDCNLGYSYGNPLISKLKDGTWVVFVTSGYNNNKSGSAADGQGFLYVLNAATGKIIKKIGTGVGDSLAPSGLGKINNWVDDGLSDNTTERVYGVDLMGNLWRFDVNGAAATGSLAQLVTTFRSAAFPGGQPQSITTKPELALIGGRPFVYVATGRYLGTGDITDTQVQTLYAVFDMLTTTTPSNTVPLYVDVRAVLQQVAMTNAVIDGQAARTATCVASCGATDGWFVDFPEQGERVNVDMKLQLGTLTVLSNVPGNSACTTGGFSFINFFDYTSGLPVSTANGMVSLKLADSLAVGLNIVRLPSGKTVAIGTTSDSKQRTTDVPISSPGLLGRRVSWRELLE